MKIKTSFGELFVKKSGEGRPILFINGGPGMSHTYMSNSFTELESKCELIFFDQLGCGSSEIPEKLDEEATVASTAELIDILELKADNYNIITHSWGAYILGAAFTRGLINNLPKKVILLNPTPFEKSAFDNVGGKLVSRIPEDVLVKIGELSNQGTDEAGAELMKMALPYYSGRDENLPDVDVEYRISTFNSVSASLEQFNFEESFKPMLDRCYFVFGSTDYITSKDFPYFSEEEQPENTLLSGGHYAFVDDNFHLMKLIRKFF